jgi:hypothetical protein
MSPDYFRVHSNYAELEQNRKQERNQKQKQINQYELYEKILDGLIKMELFCISCCVNQTNIICSNSKIQIKDYSVGYTHTQSK